MGLFGKSKEQRFAEETQEVVEAMRRGHTSGAQGGNMVKEAREKLREDSQLHPDEYYCGKHGWCSLRDPCSCMPGGK